MDLNKFLSILIYYQFNCKVLHWKIKGSKFDTYHAIAEEYYQHLNDDMDVIAEMVMATGDNPVDLEKAHQVLSDAEDKFKVLKGDQDFSDDTFCDNIEVLFTDILSAIKKLLEECDKVKDNPGNRSKLESMYEYYDLELNYKNKRRKK